MVEEKKKREEGRVSGRRGRLGVEGIVEGERVVGEDSRDGLFDLRSRLPPLRFQLFSSLFNNFPSSFFFLYRVVETVREREGEGG